LGDFSLSREAIRFTHLLEDDVCQFFFPPSGEGRVGGPLRRILLSVLEEVVVVEIRFQRAVFFFFPLSNSPEGPFRPSFENGVSTPLLYSCKIRLAQPQPADL